MIITISNSKNEVSMTKDELHRITLETTTRPTQQIIDIIESWGFESYCQSPQLDEDYFVTSFRNKAL